MDGFSYVDIYASKGIEYLLAIVFLGMLIVFWKFLNQPVAAAVQYGVRKAQEVREWFRFQKDLYYHQGHSWVRPETATVVTVGIDDFAQALVGKPNAIVLPKVGSRIELGEKAWRMQIDSKPIEFLSPVNGQVVAVNEAVLTAPELLQTQPYDNGWLLKVQVPHMKSTLRNLLTGNLALAWLDQAITKLRSRMSGELGTVMQDGGLPVNGFARAIAPDQWDQLAAEFLLTESEPSPQTKN